MLSVRSFPADATSLTDDKVRILNSNLLEVKQNSNRKRFFFGMGEV